MSGQHRDLGHQARRRLTAAAVAGVIATSVAAGLLTAQAAGAEVPVPAVTICRGSAVGPCVWDVR